jgi:hypothetical protein
MINTQELMNGFAVGTILIVIGLVPGLLDKWTNAVSNFAEHLLYRTGTRYPWRKQNSFAELLLSRMASEYRSQKQFAQHRWVAALGMALIALFLYTSH